MILNELWGLPPALDMDYEKRVHDAMREIVAAGLAESAHDVSDGGLAVAAAECCLGGVGAALHFESDLSAEFLLFHEGPSRILVSTASPDAVMRDRRAAWSGGAARGHHHEPRIGHRQSRRDVDFCYYRSASETIYEEFARKATAVITVLQHV